jgi:hypothetical protein
MILLLPLRLRNEAGRLPHFLDHYRAWACGIS